MSESTINPLPYEHIITKIEADEVLEIPENRNILFVRKLEIEAGAKIIIPAGRKLILLGGY